MVTDESEFIVMLPDGEVEFASTGPAASFLLEEGHANAER